jgi:release factor glutamine methyltransferase
MEKSRDVWTISSLLNWTINYFKSKGIESARLDAEVLLSHVLGQKRIYLYVHFDEPGSNSPKKYFSKNRLAL